MLFGWTVHELAHHAYSKTKSHILEMDELPNKSLICTIVNILTFFFYSTLLVGSIEVSVYLQPSLPVSVSKSGTYFL
uniref:Uncharacterized protein n=1 Tax=Rhizophora mucronata TaxID=61149 RepID=A0A2P2NDQ4_RHIMU